MAKTFRGWGKKTFVSWQTLLLENVHITQISTEKDETSGH